MNNKIPLQWEPKDDSSCKRIFRRKKIPTPWESKTYPSVYESRNVSSRNVQVTPVENMIDSKVAKKHVLNPGTSTVSPSKTTLRTRAVNTSRHELPMSRRKLLNSTKRTKFKAPCKANDHGDLEDEIDSCSKKTTNKHTKEASLKFEYTMLTDESDTDIDEFNVDEDFPERSVPFYLTTKRRSYFDVLRKYYQPVCINPLKLLKVVGCRIIDNVYVLILYTIDHLFFRILRTTDMDLLM